MHIYTYAQYTPISLKNVFDEALKCNFISRTYLFNILVDKIGAMHKAVLMDPQTRVIGLQTERAIHFMECLFT